MKKFFKILCILVVVCAVVAGAIFVWEYQSGRLFTFFRMFRPRELLLTPIEALAYKKCQVYSQYLTDPQLKGLASNAAEHHKQHFNAMMQYLNCH